MILCLMGRAIQRVSAPEELAVALGQDEALAVLVHRDDDHIAQADVHADPQRAPRLALELAVGTVPGHVDAILRVIVVDRELSLDGFFDVAVQPRHSPVTNANVTLPRAPHRQGTRATIEEILELDEPLVTQHAQARDLEPALPTGW